MIKDVEITKNDFKKYAGKNIVNIKKSVGFITCAVKNDRDRKPVKAAPLFGGKRKTRESGDKFWNSNLFPIFFSEEDGFWLSLIVQLLLAASVETVYVKKLVSDGEILPVYCDSSGQLVK